MSIGDVVDLLRCPHCAQPFETGPPTLRCAAGHTFDVARGGQLNLLTAAQPRNADTAAMITAREALQATGLYDQVSDAIGAAVPERAAVIIDAGAGPGHHLAAVVEAEPARRGLAIDVSVAAARRAARAHPRIGSVIADVWKALPVVDACADVVLNVFAPRHPSEFARVLRRHGALIIATPRPDHLVELRQALGLLDVQAGKDERLAQALSAAFDLVDQHDVITQTSWSSHSAQLAAAMGPNAFHVSGPELDGRIAALSWPRPVTVSCRVSVWRRR